MFPSRPRTEDPTAVPPLDQVEAALLDRYTRLVTLAYLTLPGDLTRHHRVLAAHGIVQGALPGVAHKRAGEAPPAVPAQGGPGAPPGLTWLRVRVLRAALAYGQRPRGWPRPLPPPRALTRLLPVVWGLRMFPRAGGAEETALAAALARVPAPVRAAFVLRHLDGLPDGEVARLLRAAGHSAAEDALRASRALDTAAAGPAEALLRSREFDACSVQMRPGDLLRRRRRFRLAWMVTAVAAAGAVLLTLTLHSAESEPVAAPTSTVLGPGPDDLVRVSHDVWADTSRVDFTAWPVRGARADDRSLLARALSVWAEPPAGTRVTKAYATTAEPPGSTPQLLYAGDVDGHTVVVLHQAQLLVHYSETAGRPAALHFARADDADVTTAAAITVSRDEGRNRYLLAPWIVASQSRDLLRPDDPGDPLAVGEDGVTAPVSGPAADGGCDRLPVLELRSSSRIVEKHAFLVTDLGGLTPAHLSYTPLPGDGVPARQPREATGPAARASWQRSGCRLAEFGDHGVRAVNLWDFATQDLPQNAGQAVWSCARATTWQGPGEVLVQFRPPGARTPDIVVDRARPTAACSRFGQHVVASTHWKAPSGATYLLAAGSREVTGIEMSGAVEGSAEGRTMAKEAPQEAEPRVRARLSDGSELAPVGEGSD
ncbi:hypothetical protein ACIQAC_19165 [Streptomyces sp. NPDC088387]|uniref:hypothetical protein n=1 Tax=Streptomyces sp. NPDC088387 TaxID=3365859 RepID=UPI0037F239E2